MTRYTVMLFVLVLATAIAGCNHSTPFFEADPGGPTGVEDAGDPDVDVEPCGMLICYCSGTSLKTQGISCDEWDLYRAAYGATPGACLFEGQACTP